MCLVPVQKPGLAGVTTGKCAQKMLLSLNSWNSANDIRINFMRPTSGHG